MIGWARTMAGRFMLLLAGTVLLANLAAILLLSIERDRDLREARQSSRVELISTLALALDGVGAGQRRILMSGRVARGLQLSLTPHPKVAHQDNHSRPKGIAAGIAAMTSRSNDQIRVRLTAKTQHRAPALFSVQLRDGTWMNGIISLWHPPRRGPGQDVLVPLLLSLAAVLAVGVWFISRITRPIKALGDAALRAGRGDHSAMVPETGTTELRRMAEAFNEMQRQIALFDADRAQTVAALGHDLRTPITSLRLRAELLDNSEGEAMIRILDEMAVMADDLLKWGKGTIQTEPLAVLDLGAMLRDLCADLSTQGQTLSYHGPKQVMMKGRRIGLKRGFANILDNARRYGAGGRVNLRIDGKHATITIEDNGSGIAAGDLPDIFDPFVRGEKSRASETGGAGLGLAIAKRVFEHHGGKIAITNGPAGGAQVVIDLPLTPV